MSLQLSGIGSALLGTALPRQRAAEARNVALLEPMPTARRIGFVSVHPNATTSGLAVATARALGNRRTEPVLAVDATGSDHGIAARLGVQEAREPNGGGRPRHSAEARSGLPAAENIRVLRLRTGTAVGDSITAWQAEAAPLARFFDVTITDFGARRPQIDLSAAASLCDCICLVTASDRSSAELARSLVYALSRIPEHPVPALALVAPGRSDDTVTRAIQRMTIAPVVSIPFGAGLDESDRRLHARTQDAVLELTATLTSAGAVHA